MTNDRPTEASEWLYIIAEQRGLMRALALTPALSRPALKRATQSLPPPPTGAITEPAGWIANETHQDET